MLRARVDRAAPEAVLRTLSGPAEVLAMRAAVERVEVDDDLLEYVVALVDATRAHPHIQVGASPRGGLALVQLARARAVLSGGTTSTPEDVKSVAVPALAHRVTLKPELWVRQIERDDVIARDHRSPCPPRRPCRARSGTRQRTRPFAGSRPGAGPPDPRAARAAPPEVRRALGGDGSAAHSEPPAAPWRLAGRTRAEAGHVGRRRPGRRAGHRSRPGCLRSPSAPLPARPRPAERHDARRGSRPRSRWIRAAASRASRSPRGSRSPTTASRPARPRRHPRPRGPTRPPRRRPAPRRSAASPRSAGAAGRSARSTSTCTTAADWPGAPCGSNSVRSPSSRCPPTPASRRSRSGCRNRLGEHTAAQRGEGVEVIGVHPYVRGERQRRIHWPATTRRGTLQIHQFAAERTADTVVLLDVLADVVDPVTGASSLDETLPGRRRAGPRLPAHPRPGRRRVGRRRPAGCNQEAATRTSTGSSRACWRSARTSPTARRRLSRLPPPALPEGALVYVITPLTDQRILDVLHQAAPTRPTRWSWWRSRLATRASGTRRRRGRTRAAAVAGLTATRCASPWSNAASRSSPTGPARPSTSPWRRCCAPGSEEGRV